MTTPRLARAAVTATTLAVAASGLVATAPATASPNRPTTSVALHLYRQQVRPVTTVGDVSVGGDGFGSAVAAVPGHADQVYGLTDRGPNVDGPDGTKIEPVPGFVPSIGRFTLRHGRAVLTRRIKLRAADGTPYNGQVNSDASTGETITDLAGHVLPTSRYGYDPEGLVALRNGSFWVSDEYGPFITHFDRHGRATKRLSPYTGTLPRELARRTPNKGMEGLTITPDGRTLVGIMQNALTQADVSGKPGKVAVTRIVTVDLRTGDTHEYAYVLDDPADTGTGVSEITALSNTEFVVDERDGDFGPGADKKLWRVDLAEATDIGPKTAAGRYDPDGGLRIGGLTVEAVAGTGDVAATTSALTAAGITPVTKRVYLDLDALVSGVSPDATFFAHDKIEGVAILHRGRRVIISNDSDFGIDASTGDTAPFGVRAKTLPDGRQDFGEFLVIDRTLGRS